MVLLLRHPALRLALAGHIRVLRAAGRLLLRLRGTCGGFGSGLLLRDERRSRQGEDRVEIAA